MVRILSSKEQALLEEIIKDFNDQWIWVYHGSKTPVSSFGENRFGNKIVYATTDIRDAYIYAGYHFGHVYAALVRRGDIQVEYDWMYVDGAAGNPAYQDRKWEKPIVFNPEHKTLFIQDATTLSWEQVY